MKHVGFIVIAGSSLAPASTSSQAQAAPLEYCRHFAREAVEQFEAANEDAVCADEVGGLRWHADDKKI